MLREAHQKFAVKPMGRACNQRMDQVVGRLAVTESQAEKNRFKQIFFIWVTLAAKKIWQFTFKILCLVYGERN
ncbi:hypothetical protein PMIT1313_01488 [Prochlorococcus marinus str. MIT 1313]|nr:hypothetical protein PMIT1313_01488 [Prochlorococcus marinus str. MIT 1313]